MGRPRRVVLAVAGALALVIVAAGLVVLDRDGRLPSPRGIPLLTDPAECTVAGVGLDREQAQRLTTSAAAARRASTPVRTAVAQIVPAAEVAAVTPAVNGRREASLSCRVDVDPGAAARQPLRADGLTARADLVRQDVLRTFGAVQLGGFAPGGVRTGHREGSAHYEGRAVDIFFRPISGANQVRGWALAHYLVAHAERLDVATVIFDGRIWTRWRSGEGWRSYDIDTGDVPRATRQILEHRDHVHVDTR